MKVRYSLYLLALAIAVLQLAEVAKAAAFVCRADILTPSGGQKAVSGWLHADSAERAAAAWAARVQGHHQPLRIDAFHCAQVNGPARR